ncbi:MULTISPECIES: DUF6415 family natural product biosynthesis protein [unclassified Streptomyces]|uniref:DUF6415 family natural product biosynthesis protein n=1 Tax=unclassified Streptomyces TaxID=2593676 RepID=UPI003D8BCA41
MTNPTARPSTAEDQVSVDLETMRAAVDRLLDPDSVPEALPPALDDLDALTLLLRGHLDLLMPAVDQLARKLSKNSIPRYCALACIGEARSRLREQPSSALGGALAHARRLARALNALCDHFEALAQAAP